MYTHEFIIQALISVGMIVILEGLLSVDNMVVISKIANKAGPKDRDKVVKYGIIGAFVFRGLSLTLVSTLMANPAIGDYGKILGGLYLIRLAYGEWTKEEDITEEGDVGGIERFFTRIGVNVLLLIILECELVDIVFGIDNILATVAFTENVPGTLTVGSFSIKWSLLLTIIGVFLGIIGLRFITVLFMKLLDKYPSLNTSALIVIGILGLKLVLSGGLDLTGLLPGFNELLENHTTDFVLSGFMLLIFLFPVFFPRKPATV